MLLNEETVAEEKASESALKKKMAKYNQKVRKMAAKQGISIEQVEE